MMENLVFAAIADDDTGASDLAGMLAEQRVSTLLVIDLPAEEQFLEWSHGCDAVVMAEGTRNLAPALAREKARQALQIAATREPRVVEVKYCSTFDSTPAGNIGPAIDAAMDELSEGYLIIAGSCSEATRKQNAWFAAQGGRAFRLDPRDLLGGGKYLADLRAQINQELSTGRACLCFTSDGPQQVREIQQWGAASELSVPALGGKIAAAMAALTNDILRGQPVAGLIVAGGETSGAICRQLGLGALRVGRNIEPGVPLCFSLGRFRQPVALKSGNFGSEDFYGRALRAMAHAGQPLG
ncbi:MAG: four-carbon acid sugar kinase family protein [Blastocatellia bacterium]